MCPPVALRSGMMLSGEAAAGGFSTTDSSPTCQLLLPPPRPAPRLPCLLSAAAAPLPVAASCKSLHCHTFFFKCMIINPVAETLRLHTESLVRINNNWFLPSMQVLTDLSRTRQNFLKKKKYIYIQIEYFLFFFFSFFLFFFNQVLFCARSLVEKSPHGGSVETENG